MVNASFFILSNYYWYVNFLAPTNKQIIDYVIITFNHTLIRSTTSDFPIKSATKIVMICEMCKQKRKDFSLRPHGNKKKSYRFTLSVATWNLK